MCLRNACKYKGGKNAKEMRIEMGVVSGLNQVVRTDLIEKVKYE